MKPLLKFGKRSFVSSARINKAVLPKKGKRNLSAKENEWSALSTLPENSGPTDPKKHAHGLSKTAALCNRRKSCYVMLTFWMSKYRFAKNLRRSAFLPFFPMATPLSFGFTVTTAATFLPINEDVYISVFFIRGR